LPPAREELQPNGDTSTRITFPNITLKPGDTLTLHGAPDNTEPAPVDYIEITR
jgi:alpha-glucuronidase